MVIRVHGQNQATTVLVGLLEQQRYAVAHGDGWSISAYHIKIIEQEDIRYPLMDSVDCELERRIWFHLRQLDGKARIVTEGGNQRTDTVVLYIAPTNGARDIAVRAIMRGLEDIRAKSTWARIKLRWARTKEGA